MAGITLVNTSTQTDGLRPVNLQTDLSELADLIETAFASTMDTGGRSAIREMRQLSRVGVGLGLLSHLNELAQGMSLGYVWVQDGHIIGNVSVYPADYPAEMGKFWIIANVAVYPQYRGQGIATRMMQASLDMIHQRRGGSAILQVDYDNEIARHMYRKLGFVEERAWTQWRRSAYQPPGYLNDMAAQGERRIVSRQLGNAQAEYALARQVRPQARGGVDWLQPTHLNTFRIPLLKRLHNWLNLRDVQRLVIWDDQRKALLGWMQIETAFGMSSRQITLMTHPDYQEEGARSLLSMAVRRYGEAGLVVSHPHDDTTTTAVLRRCHFSARRTVMHMRLNLDQADTSR